MKIFFYVFVYIVKIKLNFVTLKNLHLFPYIQQVNKFYIFLYIYKS